MKVLQQFLPINFRKGRTYNGKTYKILGICNHISVGLRGSVTSWFNNPASQASYHYFICKNGDIIQFVRDEDTAWSQGGIKKPSSKLYFDNGEVNPNRYLLSISHEVISTEPLTEAQYQSSLWVHKQLIEKYNIPITREFIIGHYELDSVNRPNDPQKAFPWDRLMQDLKSWKNGTVTPIIEVKVNPIANTETKGGINNMYNDKDKISDWALSRVARAKELELMLGDNLGNFNPKGTVTREMLAVVAVNIYDKLIEDLKK
jgi:hypothetical protein